MLSWKRLHSLTKIFLVLKAAKYEIQKPSTCSATFFRCKFWSMFRVFHLAWSTCRPTKTFVAGWRKLLRKVERRSFLASLLVFDQTHNLPRNKFTHVVQQVEGFRISYFAALNPKCYGISQESRGSFEEVLSEGPPLVGTNRLKRN